MIARNFYEGDANLLYPEIDYAGSQSGIIGSEFPFFNYLIYLLATVFDYDHWYGRLINLVVSSIGIYFFFLILRKISNTRVAFNAAMILLVSIWFSFSRKIMPDTFSVSLVIIGLYFGYVYLVSGSKLKIALYFLFVTLGVLSKLPSISLLSVLILIFFIPGIPKSRRAITGMVSAFSLVIVMLWYYFWVPYLVTTFHNQLYFPRGFVEGFMEILPNLDGFFRNFYFNAFHSYIAFICFIVGLYFGFSQKSYYFKIGVSLLFITFFAFILKTGVVFPLHNYYIIPFVPLMAFLAAIALEKIPHRYQNILLIFIGLEGILNQQHDFFIREHEGYKMELEEITELAIDRDALIVINGGPSPQEIYLAHRKGWTVTNQNINIQDLEAYKNAGASFLIINQRTFPSHLDYLPVVMKGKDYSIYRLDHF